MSEMSDNPKKRFLSPQAKRAAIETRRLNAEQNPLGGPQIFIVRHADPHRFGWEIRKFGSFVLKRSEADFDTQSMAREAGETALAEMTA